MCTIETAADPVPLNLHESQIHCAPLPTLDSRLVLDSTSLPSPGFEIGSEDVLEIVDLEMGLNEVADEECAPVDPSLSETVDDMVTSSMAVEPQNLVSCSFHLVCDLLTKSLSNLVLINMSASH